jgi:hypothetical protein
MKTSPERLAYAKAYREKNRESIKQKNKIRRRKAVLKRRVVLVGKAKCEFCGRRLASENAGLKVKRYCAPCKKDPEVRRHLRNLYMRRYFQKKRGNEPESIIHAEDIIE